MQCQVNESVKMSKVTNCAPISNSIEDEIQIFYSYKELQNIRKKKNLTSSEKTLTFSGWQQKG